MPTGQYERKPRANYSYLIGQKKHKITCIGIAGKRLLSNGHKIQYIHAICECGNKYEMYVDLFGKAKSCKKCLKGKNSPFYKHNGEYEHPRLYIIWGNMRKRCSDRCDKGKRKYYFDRGIKVCKDWDDSFIVFRDWALKNGYSDNLSLDRIDNNGNYEPSNCRWATHSEQTNNTRRNVFIEYMGLRKTIAQWMKITGGRTIESRLYYKSPLEKVFKGYEDKINAYIAANPHELVEQNVPYK